MAELIIEHVSKKIMGKMVLDDISLKVPDKSFTVIYGNAGSGKTTLLRIIAGVEKLDKGKIYLNGKDITGLSPKDRNIAMVYQNFALYPHMTVYDNIANPLKAKRLSKEEINKKVNRVSETLGIQDLLSRYPRELSGGQAQRVAIARALVRDAELYLLDEPLTNLDYKIREAMREELKNMCKELSLTFIYASPDPLDALMMADQVAIINKGKLLQYGLTKEVYYSPQSIEVATIFGAPSINIFDAITKDEGEHLLLESQFFKIDVTKYKDKLFPNMKYKIGIRPHHLSFSKEIIAGTIAFPVEIYLTHVVGSETICYARSNGLEITIYVPYIYRITSPEKTYAYFNPDRMLLFDSYTGLRVI
ncbi:MAG: ABC transporter ATP-binding protein [Nitrososphaeria archaeon]